MAFSTSRICTLFLDALFPPLCVGCGRHLEKENRTGVCARCLQSIRIFTALSCPVCGARLPEGKKICHKNTPYALAAATDYKNETVRKIIHAYKYKGVKTLVGPITCLIDAHIKSLGINIAEYTLVPVPLHPKRSRSRGFNQSQLIADSLSVRYGLPCKTLLKRIKNTRTQMTLDKKERHKNIENSFSLAVPPSEVKNKSVILVDDVLTSGATAGEAVKTLKHHGVRKIIVLVAARA